jgi:DNA-binding transcriptional MerR regulator
VHRLRFIRRARALGLPLQHLKALAAVLDGGPRATVRPRLLVLVRAQLSAVHEQITELQLLQEQLEQVLHRLLTRRAPNHAEGCRCLETDVVPVGTGKPSRLRQGNTG